MTPTNGLNDNAVSRGLELRADTAIKGLETAVPSSLTQVVLGTVTFKIPDLIAYFQGLEQPWKEARSAHATLRQIGMNRPADSKLLRDALANLKGALVGFLGHDSEDLTKFGFKPTKPKKPLTSEQKAIKAAKAKLTRQKRGTLGKKQKAAIKETANPTVTIGPDGKVAITASSTAPMVQGSSSTTAPVSQAPIVAPASPPASPDPQASGVAKP
jgi:hypothetical protein